MFRMKQFFLSPLILKKKKKNPLTITLSNFSNFIKTHPIYI